DALKAGDCSAGCQRRIDPTAMEKTVCPFGFWGVRCVIERRLHDNKKSAAAEPTGRHGGVLKPLGSVLVGASPKADAGVATSVADMLARIRRIDPQCRRVTEWSQWPAGVAAAKPTTLALVVHQETDAGGLPSIEIGPPPLLNSDFLKEKHV